MSKFINVTEQPNERDLHNIAMMIQAYLDHQNSKSNFESYKVKHEGSRDKIAAVILKIRMLFDVGDASPEKVTKTIKKHLKPFYGDVESADCQQINEESLGSSVDLLYKNYLENAECNNDGEGIVGDKENLRKRTTMNTKTLSSNWHSTNSEDKPDIKSILSEDELYKYFHKGKMPRQRPTFKLRRLNKRSRNLNSPLYRSRDQSDNNSEKPKARSKVLRKTSNKKLRKQSLKTGERRGKCEKYAIRKFTVSLRPVIERYMALLECQLDNTLRSLNYDRASMNPYYLYASKLYSNKDSPRQKKLLRNTKLTRKNTERSRNISPDNNILVQRNDDINYPKLRKYSLKEITGMHSPSSAPKTFTDFKDSSTNTNNDYSELFQSPPMYDDYDGIYKTQSHDLNGFKSLINQLSVFNDNENTRDQLINKKIDPPLNEEPNKNLKNTAQDIFYEEEFQEEPMPLSEVSDQQTEASNTLESDFTDLTKLSDVEQVTDSYSAQRPTALKSYESISQFLKNARDASLQTPEFAVPFALDTNKGYVELTHLVKYPKIIVYRPQFIVKNTMPYDDFLKTMNTINMTNDDVRLMKIVRHLPDNTVKVLFETEDFEPPFEVRNIHDNRRSGSPITAVESRTDTTKKNYRYGNADFTDGDSDDSISIYRDEVNSNIVDMIFKSSGIDGNNSHYESNTIDSASNTPFDSSFSSGFLPRFASGVIPNKASGLISGLDSGKSESEPKGSAIAMGSKLGANIGLDTALSMVSPLNSNPLHSSKLFSFLSKFMPSYSNSKNPSNVDIQSEITSKLQTYLNPYSNLHSLTKSTSNSLLSSILNSNPVQVPDKNPGTENEFPSTIPSTENQWWIRWKNILKGKIKVKQ